MITTLSTKREGGKLPIGQQSLVSEIFVEQPVSARWYGCPGRGGGAGEGAVGGYSVSLSFITKPWALGGNLGCIRKPSRAGQTPCSLPQRLSLGLFGVLDQPPGCVPAVSSLLFMQMGTRWAAVLTLQNSLQVNLQELTSYSRRWKAPRAQVGNAKGTRVGEWGGGAGRRRTFMTHSCMMDDNLHPALFGCQEAGDTWDVVKRGREFWKRLASSWGPRDGGQGGGSGKIPLLGKESMVSELDCHVLLIHTSVHLIPQWH